MKITNVAVAATALSAALVLSACGGQQDPATATNPTTAPPSASVEAAAGHNEADTVFAQGMIPHHQQAVTMSRLATDRADSDEVRDLATAIERAQDPEIAQMRSFLTAWGAPESGGMPGMDHDGMGHGTGSGTAGTDHGGMAGMMTAEQMQQLEQGRGVEFDRIWLQMMIAHHEGAVQMAQTELRDGANPEARALAQKIIDAQQAEISQMKQMLG